MQARRVSRCRQGVGEFLALPANQGESSEEGAFQLREERERRATCARAQLHRVKVGKAPSRAAYVAQPIRGEDSKARAKLTDCWDSSRRQSGREKKAEKKGRRREDEAVLARIQLG